VGKVFGHSAKLAGEYGNLAQPMVTTENRPGNLIDLFHIIFVLKFIIISCRLPLAHYYH